MCTSSQQGRLQAGMQAAGRKADPPRITHSDLEELQRVVRVQHETVARDALRPPMHCLSAARPGRHHGKGATGRKEGGEARTGMGAALAARQDHGNPRTPTMHGRSRGAVSA